MSDPNFKKSIVLLIDHSPRGAFGFVVNRPSAVSLRSLIALEREVPLAIPAWYGGPVEQGSGIIMHSGSPLPGDNVLCEGVSLSSTEQALHKMIDEMTARYEDVSQRSFCDVSDVGGEASKESLYSYRFLVGSAGWGPAQLDEELRYGGWVQIPLDRSLLFNVPWASMWDVAFGRLGVKPAELVHTVQAYLN